MRRHGSPPRALALDPGMLALAALVALAAALRFTRIGYQGYWFDEGNTVLLVHFSPGQMLGLIPQTESTPPLYYCVAWVWARLFGFQEAGLRSLSAVAGVLAIPALYATAAKLGSRRAGLIVAALAACNPLLVWYSQEARAYSLLVLMSSLSLVAFAFAFERPSPRALAVWAITALLALATHYYALLAVVPEALVLLFRHRRFRAMWAALAAVAAGGAALLPYALGQEATGHASWIANAPLGRRLGQLIPQFVAGFSLPAGAVLEPLALALAALGVLLALTRAGRVERRLATLAGGVGLGGLALNLLLIGGGVDDLLTRNLLALWGPAALAAAAGFAAPRPRLVGIAAAVALCAIGVAGVIQFETNRSLQRPDWRVVARALDRPAPGSPFAPPTRGAIVPLAMPRRVAQAGFMHGSASAPPRARGAGAGAASARVILIQHYRTLLPLSLYLPHLRFLPSSGARVAEIDVVSFTAPPSSGFCWWGSACNLSPSRMQASYSIPGFRAVSRTRALQFTVLRLVARQPRLITASVVARALRLTTLREDDLLVQRS
jgi:mannosyltransferase